MRKEDLPNLKEAMKRGWRALCLPIIVFLPFFLDSKCTVFFAGRLGGAGARAFSDSILLFIPSLIVVCAIFLSGRETIRSCSLPEIWTDIAKGMDKVVPTGALVMFAYFVSNCLDDVNVGVAIGEFIGGLQLHYFSLMFLIPLFTAVLGMLIPGSTQVKIFGTAIITVVAAAGGNPFLAAAMLPCICGAMHGVTPPYATCVYIAMGIADADFKRPSKTVLSGWEFIIYCP